MEKGDEVTQAQSRRKRGSLSPAEIVLAAIKVLDNEGPDALTFIRLGRELKASSTAVYRHFSSRQELIVAVADYLDSLSLLDYTPTDSWREDLTNLAWRAWNVANQHPAAASIAMGLITNGESELKAVDSVLRAICQAGLSGRQAVIHYQVYGNLVLGGAMAQGLRLSDELYSASAGFTQSYSPADPTQFPYADSLKDDLRIVDYTQVFGRQVEMYLDALEVAAARTSTH